MVKWKEPQQSVAGYGPQAVAMQSFSLAAKANSTAVGRRLTADVGAIRIDK